MRNWETQKYNTNIQCNEDVLTKISKTSAHSQWIHNQLINTIYDVTLGTGLRIPYTPRNFFITLKYVNPDFLSREWVYAGGTENNEDLQVDNCMQRWVDTTLNSSYIAFTDANRIYNSLESVIAKSSDPYIRVWDVEVPINKDQYDEIVENPFKSL